MASNDNDFLRYQTTFNNNMTITPASSDGTYWASVEAPCSECGAQVADISLHEDWHARIEQIFDAKVTAQALAQLREWMKEESPQD